MSKILYSYNVLDFFIKSTFAKLSNFFIDASFNYIKHKRTINIMIFIMTIFIIYRVFVVILKINNSYLLALDRIKLLENQIIHITSLTTYYKNSIENLAETLAQNIIQNEIQSSVENKVESSVENKVESSVENNVESSVENKVESSVQNVENEVKEENQDYNNQIEDYDDNVEQLVIVGKVECIKEGDEYFRYIDGQKGELYAFVNKSGKVVRRVKRKTKN
jgi:hypothetical protein